MVNSNAKGKRGERELAALIREVGFTDARRGQQYKGTPDSPDVVGIPGHHIECKFVEALNVSKAYEQAVSDAQGLDEPLVFHKKSRGPWLVTLDARYLLAMLYRLFGG